MKLTNQEHRKKWRIYNFRFHLAPKCGYIFFLLSSRYKSVCECRDFPKELAAEFVPVKRIVMSVEDIFVELSFCVYVNKCLCKQTWMPEMMYCYIYL